MPPPQPGKIAFSIFFLDVALSTGLSLFPMRTSLLRFRPIFPGLTNALEPIDFFFLHYPAYRSTITYSLHTAALVSLSGVATLATHFCDCAPLPLLALNNDSLLAVGSPFLSSPIQSSPLLPF